MSDVNFCEIGGASSSIVPSARRSIHNHLNCPFGNTSGNMVTYGLDKDIDDSSNDQGVDVVDNIQSKPAFPVDSPTRLRGQKRYSFAAENDFYTEDSDINALSKSVPAALPSHSYYSDQENQSPNENIGFHSPNRSGHANSPNRCFHGNSPNKHSDLNSLNQQNRNRDLNSLNQQNRNRDLNSLNRQNRNRNLNSLNQQNRNRDVNSLNPQNRYRDLNSPNRSNPSLNNSNYSHQSSSPNSPERRHSNLINRSTNTSNYGRILETSQYNQKEQSSFSNTSIITILSVVAILVSIYLGTQSFNVSNVSASTYDEATFFTDLSGLGEKYNVDEDSILKLQTGISTIAGKQDTGSFIFVYNSDLENFNGIEFNKFMHEVSFAASKYLRNDSTRTIYTTVEGKKLDMKEHCELISRYKPDLERTGLMLLRHVEEVPSDLAMAFHYYCDEYHPLVKKSAIFFTLNLAKCPQGPGQKSHHDLIEKCLKKKWSGVSTDSIGPLLTRVINVVIDVTTTF